MNPLVSGISPPSLLVPAPQRPPQSRADEYHGTGRDPQARDSPRQHRESRPDIFGVQQSHNDSHDSTQTKSEADESHDYDRKDQQYPG